MAKSAKSISTHAENMAAVDKVKAKPLTDEELAEAVKYRQRDQQGRVERINEAIDDLTRGQIHHPDDLADKTLRDRGDERQKEAIAQQQEIQDLNKLANVALDQAPELDQQAEARSFYSCLAELVDCFGEAEEEWPIEMLGESRSEWSERPTAFIRQQFIGRICQDADFAIKSLEARLEEQAARIVRAQRRFDGSSVEDEKIQRMLRFGGDLDHQHDQWHVVKMAAEDLFEDETGRPWKPYAPEDAAKLVKTQSMADANAFVAAWGKRSKK